MIIIAEPQCKGYEHTQVNAALIILISKVLNDSILFLAEREHLKMVNEILIEYKINNVVFGEVNVPERNLSEYKRFFKEYKLIRYILGLSKDKNCNQILFSSITSAGLWGIKLLLNKFKKLNIIVIPHSILETVDRRPSFNPLNFLFWMRFNLLLLNKSNIKFLLYSYPSREALCNLLPNMKKFTFSIDHPYLYRNNTFKLRNSSCVRFGSFGYGQLKKGTDTFISLANVIKNDPITNNAEFIIIGKIIEPKITELVNKNIIVPSNKELDRETFDKYANSLDYAVFCFNINEYRYSVSGTFYDALSYVKPIIALKNNFFEYFFNKLGNIGYLCDTYEDLVLITKKIILNELCDNYEIQCKNIIKGREMLGLKQSYNIISNLFNTSLNN